MQVIITVKCMFVRYVLPQNQMEASNILCSSSSSSNIASTNIASTDQVTRPIDIIYLNNNNNTNYIRNGNILLICLASYTSN